MPEYHYVRWFASDYMRDTRRLTQCEHGAYFLLLNEYYLTGEPLPDDDRILFRVSLSESLSDWLAIRPVIEKLFIVGDGVWRHKRCDAEIAHAKAQRNARSLGATTTNKKRWGSLSDTLSDTLTESLGVSQPDPEPEPESELHAPSSHVGADAPDAPRKGRQPVKRFTPPTPEEAQAYFEEHCIHRLGIGQKFVDHYQAAGWRLKGGNPMKDWKACIREWCTREKERGTVPTNGTGSVPVPPVAVVRPKAPLVATPAQAKRAEYVTACIARGEVPDSERLREFDAEA